MASEPKQNPWPRLAIVLAVYVVIAHVLPAPAAVTPAGWRITGVFLATIVGMMLQPLPGAALVVMALTATALLGGIPLNRTLSGFASPSVWLVLLAMLVSRTLRETGLSRRIALLFVRAVGRSSLGVSYALLMTDVTLATGIPSITARSGGIILPVARSIAELYDSTPGPSAPRLGRFLMASLYQGSVIACAMFLTGQASNILAAGLAMKIAGVNVTWASWFMAGVVPGLLSCLIVPWVVYRLVPPEVKHTPGASEYAARELHAMGPLSRAESTVLLVFASVCVLWMTSGWHRLDVTLVALGGVSALILSGVLKWSQVTQEHAAWDVFVWYGGLLAMGEILNETGSTGAFANWVGAWFTGIPWLTVLILTTIVYFYAHYAFASITTHLLAMFPPFTAMLIGLGAPPALAVYTFACLANLTAGLTHYGTTTAPIVFSERYVDLPDWWRVGAVVSVVNLVIWVGVGFVWWRVIGLW